MLQPHVPIAQYQHNQQDYFNPQIHCCGKAGQDMDLVLANRLQARKYEECTLQPVVAGKHANIPLMFNSMYGHLVIA
jgi:hypothetical protein